MAARHFLCPSSNKSCTSGLIAMVLAVSDYALNLISRYIEAFFYNTWSIDPVTNVYILWLELLILFIIYFCITYLIYSVVERFLHKKRT